MEYLPEPLSRVLRNYYPQKKYMPTPTIIQYTKCLLTGLKDLHVRIDKFRILTSVTVTLNHPTSCSTKHTPNSVILGLPKSSVQARKTYPIYVHDITEHLSCCLELFTILIKSIFGPWGA